jgi:hypothetical protein
MENKKNNGLLLVAVFILCSSILIALIRNGNILLFILLLILFAYIIISGIISRGNNKKSLFERLGISSEDELSAVLSEFDVLVSDKLYIRNGLIVNIDSYKSYHLYEIKNVEKRNITHRNRTMSYETYELIIYTETTTDTLYYYTNKSGRDCAHLLLVRKISESKSRTAKVTSQDIISNELAYSSDDYEGMIMDDEDIVDRESRSDWLG